MSEFVQKLETSFHQQQPVGQSPYHRRTTSDLRRKSMSNKSTPKRDEEQKKLSIQNQSFEKKLSHLNMSLSYINQENQNQLFPSLSQTPKFDQGIAQRNFITQNHQSLRQQRSRLKSMQGSRAKLQSILQQNQINSDKQFLAWEKNHINQFQVRNLTPAQVMEALGEICKENIRAVVGQKPDDFDSTEPIDSFIEALYVVIEENVGVFNEQRKDKMHLSTGARTEQCEVLLKYIATLQSRNKVLIDSYDFFGTYITKLQELEKSKITQDQQIEGLKNDKEQLILQKFDMERRMTEMQQAQEQFKKKEQELMKNLKLLKKKYENKKEECLSLSYRVKNMTDISNMMEPPVSHQSLGAEANAESDPAQDNNTDRNHQQQQPYEHKLRGLEQLNKKLEVELNQMKLILSQQTEQTSQQEDQKFSDNSDHFQRIQDLFNKVQIENKTLRSQNGKLESQIDSKERLISHLEGKVTSTLLEKEEIIVKLKAELLILKGQNDKFQLNLQENIEKNKVVCEKALQKQFKEQIESLTSELNIIRKEKEELMNSIEQLQTQCNQNEKEYTQFKDAKTVQDSDREGYLGEIEEKLVNINNHYEGVLGTLQANMDDLENENQVLQKSNQILDMKLNYVKESTHTLVKQKQFIKEDIEKSWTHMQQSFSVLKQTMFDANTNKDYLISVKKAAKQSQSILDLGLASLNNVLQILNFLKLEELFSMLVNPNQNEEFYQHSQQEQQQIDIQNVDILSNPSNNPNIQFIQQEPISSQQDTLEVKKNFMSKRSSEKTHFDPLEGLKIQKFLKNNSHKKDKQNYPPSIDDQLEYNITSSAINEQLQIERTENYYFHHCSLEMASILLKLTADVLLLIGACSEFEALPPKFANLLDLANEKTDSYIEQEIFVKYLIDAKKLIESKQQEEQDFKQQQSDQIQQLTEELYLLKEGVASNPLQATGQTRNQLNLTGQESEEEVFSAGQASGNEDDNSMSPPPKQQQMHHKKSTTQPQVNKQSLAGLSQLSSAKQHRMSQLYTPATQEMLNYQITDQAQLEQRRKDQRHKSVMDNVAGSNQVSAASQAQNPKEHRKLHSKKKSSNKKHKGSADDQINEQLMQQVEQLKLDLLEQKSRSKDLQLQLATRIVILEEQLEQESKQRDQDILELEDMRKQEIERTKQGIQQRENLLIQSVSDQKERIIYLEKLVSDLRMQLEMTESELKLSQQEKSEFNMRIGLKEQELVTYKENVQEYVNVKSSNRNTFGLAFEISVQNQSMINEAMVKYYLSKCLNIDKSKFRFIMSDSQDYQIESVINNKSSILNNQSHVTVAKIIIEICDDQQNIQKHFSTVKQSIRDGSCILYDLEPLYFSLNLGSFGLKGNSNLSDFHILKRKGSSLGHQEYIITILRHKINPLLFKVLAINYSLGEEYHLDLNQEDIFELLEGEGKVGSNLLNSVGIVEPQLELIDRIIENLKLISKDNMTILVCEHKIFFNNLFHNVISGQASKNNTDNKNYDSKKGKLQYDEVYKHISLKKEQNQFRNSQLRNKQILTQNNQQFNSQIEPHYHSQLLLDTDCQTDFETSLIYEGFTSMYTGNQRIGKKLEFKIQVLESQKSKSLQLICEEIKSKKKIQVCFIENQSVDDKLPSEYIIYTHCMQVKERHLVLISIEKVINDGLFIKIHDLKELSNEEFFLIKKSTGNYSKLNRSQGGGFIIKEDFRNLIYDLTFSYSTSIPSNQVLLANVTYHKELHNIKSAGSAGSDSKQQQFDLEQQLLVMPSKPRNGQVKVQDEPIQIQNLKMIATQLPAKVIQDSHGLNTTEKGSLLYRNTFIVRCSFEGAPETEQESLISFYQKKDEISVEVFLFKDAQKMSIASQVNAQDLFGQEYTNFQFSQKIEMLDQMMEKLYVLSENQAYHLKVENEAVPISQIIEARKALNQEGNLLLGGYDQDVLEVKVKEIQANRAEWLAEERTVKFGSYIIRDNHFYEYVVYFICKGERDNSDNKLSPKKNKSLSRRLTLERQMSNAEAYLEDNADFDQIYIELTDKDQEFYATLLNQKSLAEVLMKNKSSSNFKLALAKSKLYLTEFLIQLIKIDKEGGHITIDNNKAERDNFVNKFQEQVGGAYVKNMQWMQLQGGAAGANGSQSENETSESTMMKELIVTRLLMNQEVEMCEFNYDIKIFENSLKSTGQVLSFSLQLFNLNDPDVYYNYNYPINKPSPPSSSSSSSSSLDSTFFIGVDLLNLIEHPFKDELNHQSITNQVPDSISLESTLKKNFQQLFSKYIDNNLLIVVQKQKFPFVLNFSIIETSSKLQWAYQVQVAECSTYLTQNMSSLVVVDQALIEQYLVIILNEKQLKANQFDLKVLEEEVVIDDSTNSILEIEQDIDFDYLFEKELFKDLKIAISKINTHFTLQIETPNENDDSSPRNDQKHNNHHNNSSKQPKNSQILRNMPHLQEYSIDMKGKTEKVFSKLFSYIKQNDEQQIETHKFIIILAINQNSLTLKVISLEYNQQSEIIYQYIHKCQKKQDQNISSSNNNDQPFQSESGSFDREIQNPLLMLNNSKLKQSKEEIQLALKTKEELVSKEAFIMGLRSFYSQSVVDMICQTQEEIFLQSQDNKNQQNNENEGESVATGYCLHKSGRDQMFRDLFNTKIKRLQLMIKPQKKEMVLHRKTYYDETQEKLIIVLVSIDQQNNTNNVPKEIKMGNRDEIKKSKLEVKQNHMLEIEVTAFKISICEPENGKKNEFIVPFDQCFLEEELMGVNNKSIPHLKKMAKILVEERTIIKRTNASADKRDNYESTNAINDNNLNSYAIEISIMNQHQQQDDNMSRSSTLQEQQDDLQNQFSPAGSSKRQQQYNGGKTGIIMGGGSVINKRDSQQRPDEIMELDEEDEEDSAKKVEAEKRGSRVLAQQQSIIEEEQSQEDQEDTSPGRISNKMKSTIMKDNIKIDQQLDITEENYDGDIGADDLKQRQDEDESIAGQMDNMDSEQNDEQDESQLSIVLVKQLPKDEILEIMEQQLKQVIQEGLSEHMMREESMIKYIVRKKSTLDNQIIEERVITEQEIKDMIGYEGGKLMSDDQKDEMLEMLADYIMEQSQVEDRRRRQ